MLVSTRILVAALLLCAVQTAGQEDEKPEGVIRYEEKDWNGTIAAFGQVLAADARDETALLYTGKAVLQQERFEEAIPYFERLTQAYPKNPDYWMWLGRAAGLSASRASVFRAKGFVKVLRASFGKALELDPDHAEAHIAMVQFYAEAPFIVGGSMKKSRAEAEAAAQSDKASGDLAWGIYNYFDGEYETARAHLEAARDAEIKMGMAYVFLGRVYAELGLREDAIAALRATFDQDDGASFAREELAKLGAETE